MPMELKTYCSQGLIGSNAADAFILQVVTGIGKNMQRLEHRLADNRFHDVQLQLTRFRRYGDTGIVADDLEAHLIHHFRQYGVDFSRHDGRSRLQLGQIDFVEAGPRP